MAKTAVADVIIPTEFERYAIERTAELSRFGQSGIIEMPAPMAVSNVMLLDPKSNQITRVGTKVVKDETTGKKRRMRVAKATGEMF